METGKNVAEGGAVGPIPGTQASATETRRAKGEPKRVSIADHPVMVEVSSTVTASSDSGAFISDWRGLLLQVPKGEAKVASPTNSECSTIVDKGPEFDGEGDTGQYKEALQSTAEPCFAASTAELLRQGYNATF